jgi:ABC-type Fe3+ transport system substrate-binding protein
MWGQVLTCKRCAYSNRSSRGKKFLTREPRGSRVTSCERVWSISLLIVALWVVSTVPGTAGTKEIPDWRNEWEASVAASKKEGKVVVYGVPGVDVDKLFKEHFETAFPGIKVESVPDRDATERIVAERRAGRFIPDIYLGAASSSEFSSLRAQGIFQPLRPLLVLPEVLDESKWFEGKLWFIDKEEKYSLIYAVAVGTLIAVNTNLIKPHEITSYTQLVDPRWRGKIVSNDILTGTSGTGGGLIKFLYLHPNLGPNFLKKLFGEMEVTLSRDMRQMIDWLGQGRFAFALFPAWTDTEKAGRIGLPVAMVNPKRMKEGFPVVSGRRTVMVLNPAPHPNAAKVFVNWLLNARGAGCLLIRRCALTCRRRIFFRSFWSLKREWMFMFVSLEKYWHLDNEIHQLLKSLKK